ncbi:beta-lactamase family protein [Saccharopolyspora indica]|uniref:serine hydrolase domain-containing protein n=1 Tax=Saccharopolyspora indica TaxID=1229659 RepID=UPI0022EB75C5|nr:serine hydrolase domain-containing protein [Saccharopolyspora indica]MDA3644791.1 serine hydrolase [Saccharopolyspora indica]
MRLSLRRKQITAVTALVALMTATAAGPALAAPHPDVQRSLDAITAGGAPGALATAHDRAGQVWWARSGVGDVVTGDPIPERGRFRAGSVTKTFVATVVLQLVAEGRVELDSPVEEHLPGVIAGNGNDGTAITVRQLLQHTSGIYDYLQEFLAVDPEELRHRGADPAELVGIAMQHEPLFPAGTSWSYSNTNYVLAGMLVERVTGRSIHTEIAERIVEPLGLRGTHLPVRGEERLPGPHPRGYAPGEPLIDFTEFDPSIGGAAGALISTGEDLNRFYEALLGGRLLPPEQLAEMQRTIPADIGPDGAAYGLGLASVPLSCGGEFWGHGGDIIGFSTLAATTGDGRSATVVANLNPATPEIRRALFATADAAICATDRSAGR